MATSLLVAQSSKLLGKNKKKGRSQGLLFLAPFLIFDQQPHGQHLCDLP
jgi:hypothetical protein